MKLLNNGIQKLKPKQTWECSEKLFCDTPLLQGREITKCKIHTNLVIGNSTMQHKKSDLGTSQHFSCDILLFSRCEISRSF